MGQEDSNHQSKQEREPLIRPLGYVERTSVIRRIGGRELYLGNELAADPEHHDRTFDFVLSATEQRHPLTTHHHPLVDGPGNDWTAFKAAVDQARTLYCRDGSVLIHCRAGISRSTTLIATTITAEEQCGFSDAVETVQDSRPFAMPHPALHELAILYLAAHT